MDWADAYFCDCLCDIEIPDECGCVLVFRRYDKFAARLPNVAQWVLEGFQDNSRILSLWGRRLLALVQTDDPRMEFVKVRDCCALEFS